MRTDFQTRPGHLRRILDYRRSIGIEPRRPEKKPWQTPTVKPLEYEREDFSPEREG